MTLNLAVIPEGIFDPQNLYNDVYADVAPLPYGKFFVDKLDWLTEVTGATVKSYGSVVNEGTPGFPGLRTSTFVKMSLPDGRDLDLDTRTVDRTPYAAYVALFQEQHGGDVTVPQIAPYPGYEARHPQGGDFLGEKVVIGSRTLWRVIAGDQHNVGDMAERVDGTYQKVNVITKPGQGPFGFGGEITPFWAQVYKR